MNKPKTKLSVLLAKTDHLAASYKQGIKDFLQFFKDKQAAFRGETKTYIPESGTEDYPSERGNKLVVTTVDEKLQWLEETNKEFIDALFSQEATNAAGIAKAELIVDGENFGSYSSLELLRLKSLLENGELEQMYANIPVRSEDEEWTPTKAEQYHTRRIYEGKKVEGDKKTTLKENYILHDPNLKEGVNHTPTIATKSTIVKLGSYTIQKFSGDWSHRERAELLRRRTKLLSATIEALKNANDVEAIQSSMTSDKLFKYLHTGVKA